MKFYFDSLLRTKSQGPREVYGDRSEIQRNRLFILAPSSWFLREANFKMTEINYCLKLGY
jgi:hypothetical protein